MPTIRIRCLFLVLGRYLTLIVFFVMIVPFLLSLLTLEPVGKHNLIVGIGIPKTGSNKLGSMVCQSFNLTSCNRLWANLSMNSARAAIYCSHGKTIAHPDVKKDVLKRFGTECSYLGTHQDISIEHQLEELEVSYVTMLRDPISRLVSGCNYSLGKKCDSNTIVNFTREDRGYAMPNRMTKIIAGLDPACSLETSNTTLRDEEILEKAKSNLREKFIFVGILERLHESTSLLPLPVAEDVVLPRLASRGGTFKGERNELMKSLGPYIGLDQQLYHYANQLLDQKLSKNPFNIFYNYFQSILSSTSSRFKFS